MATCDRPATPSDGAPQATHTKDTGARRGSTLRRTIRDNPSLITRLWFQGLSDRGRRGCRVIACTRTWIHHMGYGTCLSQYGVTATRCTPPRVSQNGLHSSLNDPKLFRQGQAEFADTLTSSQGTRSRAYQQTVPCKRR
jgi:hypothetical protein